jgi:hypothetical protein
MEEKSLALYRPDAYVALAKSELPPEDIAVLTEYAASGGLPLAPASAAQFFNLFLNGSNAHEIQRLNKPFKLGQILDAQVRYKWSEKRDKYAMDLQDRVVEQARTAQLETTDLMANMLKAANKQHGDKLKKYIQSGDEKDLDGVLNIESLQSLLKIVDGLLKITGQDRVSKVKVSTTNTQNVNVNVNSNGGDLAPDDAAKILEIVSAAKRNKENGPKT